MQLGTPLNRKQPQNRKLSQTMRKKRDHRQTIINNKYVLVTTCNSRNKSVLCFIFPVSYFSKDEKNLFLTLSFYARAKKVFPLLLQNRVENRQ